MTIKEAEEEMLRLRTVVWKLAETDSTEPYRGSPTFTAKYQKAWEAYKEACVRYEVLKKKHEGEEK